MNMSKTARYMMMTGGRNEVDDRFRDRRGREHYDDGRYAPMKSEYREHRGDISRRTHDEDGGYVSGYYDGYTWPYNEEKEHHEEQHDGRVIGFASAMNSRSHSPFTREMAEEWMANLHNEDGTKGAHWTLEEVKRVMHQKGIECDPVKLWVAMNAEYSDRHAVNKKHGVDKLDFYVDSAVAYWLQDKDAVKDKLSAYYTYVVKH